MRDRLVLPLSSGRISATDPNNRRLVGAFRGGALGFILSPKRLQVTSETTEMTASLCLTGGNWEPRVTASGRSRSVTLKTRMAALRGSTSQRWGSLRLWNILVPYPENPRVGGSIPPLATIQISNLD